MPYTPFHTLAFLFLYFKDRRRIDPLALAVSTTFIDLEPLYYFILGEPLDHRIWHGFTLALTIYPVLVTAAVYLTERLFENRLWAIYKWARLNPVKVKYPLRNIYLLSIFGGFSHIFLDMFSHTHMLWVLYPFVYGNPFHMWQSSATVQVVVAALSVYSLICWLKAAKKPTAPAFSATKNR
ncbi:MAG: DUF4184 family protein [Candidatus Bathyarchaeia archaeon]